MANRPLLMGLLGLMLVTLMGLGAYGLQSGGFSLFTSGTALPPLGDVPAFSLRDQHDREVTQTDWQGSVVVVNFIYSRCAEACPLSIAWMLKLQTVYEHEDRVQLVSISVDPAFDTPEILASYAEGLGVRSPRWSFLTGDKEAIYRLARGGFHLGVFDPNDTNQTSALPLLRTGLARAVAYVTPAEALAHRGEDHQPIQHSARLVVVDRQGRIRQYYDSQDADILQRVERDVALLLRE
jgi:cytochrome oxidase Cu insertion factor (SCO1/SenC/PrrC family)